MAEPAIEDKQVQEVPPQPPTGALVNEQALYLTQLATWRQTLAFAGQRNPSLIWQSMVRDDSSCIVYYRELEEKDEDVSNALDTLKLSVLERDRSVTPADESGPAQDVADFIEDQLDENLPNFHAVLDTILDGPGYGFSIAEMMFDVSEGQVALLDICDCPQELFLFGTRFRPQIGPLQLLDSPWAMQGKEVPEDKFVVFTYRGRARSRMGRPLLRSVFWPSWFKRNVQRLWLQYCEKGPGTAVVRYPDGDNESERMKAVAIARAIIEEPAVAVPQNLVYDLDLLKVARTLNPDVYEHLYQMMQYAIVRRVLGQTLTSFGGEGGKGTQALGEVHEDTMDKRSIELCRALEGVVNRQIVRPLVLWNFGPDAPMPTWNLDTSEAEDLAERVTIDRTLQLMGKKFTTAYICERYGAPEVEGEAEELVPIAGPPSNPSNLKTPAGTPTDPAEPNASFEEELDARVEELKRRHRRSPKQMQADLAEFDHVFGELRDQAKSLLATRAKEIVDAVHRQ